MSNPYWNNNCITGISSDINMHSLTIQLSWNDLQNALEYNLYKDSLILASGLNEVSYIDSNVVYGEWNDPDTSCYYVEGVFAFAEDFVDCNETKVFLSLGFTNGNSISG